MNFKLRVLASALSLAFANSAFAADEPKKDAEPTPDWTWTGHVDLNSAYYLRGITNTYGNNKWQEGAPLAYANRGNAKVANGWGDAPESRNPAFSWGIDLTHSSGWYLGYWASQLTYSYDRVGKSYDTYRTAALTSAGAVAAKRVAATAAVGALNAVAPFDYYSNNNSIENDLYGGYSGKIGDLGYNVGVTYYIYAPGTHSNAPESKVALTYGDFTVQAQTLLDHTIWGNKGDTYWTATWTKALPYDIGFTANLGYYTYTKDGTYLGANDPLGNCGVNTYFFVNGCYASVKTDNTPNPDAHTISGGFRHLILGVSQPIGSTGLTWNVQAIVSGVNRFNVQQDNKVTAGISYAF